MKVPQMPRMWRCIGTILGGGDAGPAQSRACSSPSLTHPLAYPALEVVHIVGIALLVGNLVLFELRVWGVGADLPRGRAGAAGAARVAGRLRDHRRAAVW